MKKDGYSESVKTRIKPEWKVRLQQLAASENLELSDIVRRALNEFIARNRSKKAVTA